MQNSNSQQHSENMNETATRKHAEFLHENFHEPKEDDWRTEERNTQLLEERRDAERAFAQWQKEQARNDQDPPPLRSAETAPASHRSADRIHTTNYNRQAPAVRRLYAIVDNVTDTIIGGIQTHLNAASAIRTLHDLATSDTMVAKHPLDFDLWVLGSLTNDHRLIPDKARIISGQQINALIQKGEPLVEDRHSAER